MKNKLSGFVDGEVDAQDERLLLDALKRDDPLRRSWRDYCLIGDALRDEVALDADIVGGVMARLGDEPVVLAPPPASAANWRRTILALAATVAGVAVVGWVALGPQNERTDGRVASSVPQTLAGLSAKVNLPAPSAPSAALEMREYLLAHQTQSGSLQLRNGIQYVRTVVATGGITSK